MAEAPEDGSPVMGCKSGSIETLWHTYDISWADTSRISLCRIEGNPPFGHDRTCSRVKSFPQAHVDGMFAGCHPYLNATVSLNALLWSVKPNSSVGRTCSYWMCFFGGQCHGSLQSWGEPQCMWRRLIPLIDLFLFYGHLFWLAADFLCIQWVFV